MGVPDLIALVGVGITVVVVGLVILGSLRLSRKLHKDRPKQRPQPSTPPWVWVFVIALVALISYVVSGKKPPGQPAEPAMPPWVIFLLIFSGFVVLFFGFFAHAIGKSYDRDAARAFKLARAGDKDGALFELKAAMDGRKPSAPRSNALGLIHMMREEWQEAYKAFLDAEAIGGRQAGFLSNQGIALLRMERLDEAEILLEEAYLMAPTDALLACNYGTVLAELGRVDEAVAQLEKARKDIKSTIFLDRSTRPFYEREIESLVEKIEAARERQEAEEAS